MAVLGIALTNACPGLVSYPEGAKAFFGSLPPKLRGVVYEQFKSIMRKFYDISDKYAEILEIKEIMHSLFVDHETFEPFIKECNNDLFKSHKIIDEIHSLFVDNVETIYSYLCDYHKTNKVLRKIDASDSSEGTSCLVCKQVEELQKVLQAIETCLSENPA